MIRCNNFPSITLILFLCTAFTFTACKKDDPSEDLDKVLVIDNGAQSIEPGESLTYTASFVDEQGNVSAASSVQWSSENTSVVSISASGVVSSGGFGTTTITATVQEDGVTYTATVPLGIQAPASFAVVPSAIIYEVGGNIQLETVAFNSSVPTFTYSSDNNNVASVSASGLVTFEGAGSCIITVTASSHPNTPVLIPVLVVGPPVIALPVTRVEVTPNSSTLFRGETVSLQAQPYNMDGPTNADVVWSSSDPNIASVDASGVVTGHAIGEAYIYATAQGISGQAEVYVSPDTIIEVTPFSASIGAGSTRQFTARAYNIRTNSYLNSITTFDWTIPTYGFGVFDFASVNSSGLVSVNSDAIPGNLTFLIVSLPSNPDIVGFASIMASFCDCGAGNADVSTIDINNGPFSLSLFGNPSATINATARDAQGNAVSNPELRYCSDDMTVCQVDELTGEIFATGEGTATVSVCSGSYAESSTTVTVSF